MLPFIVLAIEVGIIGLLGILAALNVAKSRTR